MREQSEGCGHGEWKKQEERKFINLSAFCYFQVGEICGSKEKKTEDVQRHKGHWGLGQNKLAML